MADESIWDYGTEITLEESGASTADGVFTQADDASLTAANKADRTHIDMRLTTVDTTVNPDIGGGVNLFERVVNLEGAEDAPVPNADYPHKFCCRFPIDDDQTLTQALLQEIKMNFPDEDSDFYIENDCGQTISAGWNLRATPKSLKPAT